MSITVKFSLQGFHRVQQALEGFFEGLGGNRTVLHERYGIRTLQWIDRNFQAEGGLLNNGPWAPLAQRTISGRRKGKRKIRTAVQRARFHARILQDTGHLRQSFTAEADNDSVTVGSAVPYARYHEYGVAAHEVGARSARTFSGQIVRGNPQVGINTSRFRKITPARKAFTNPGLPQRRMLPQYEEIVADLMQTTQNYVDEIEAAGGEL